MPPVICKLLGSKTAKPVAVVLAIVGVFLNAAAYAHVHGDEAMTIRLASVLLGQVCWVITALICIVQANLFAEERISLDGKGMLIFNIVKWGAVVVYLITCAVILEVAYEGFFIFRA